MTANSRKLGRRFGQKPKSERAKEPRPVGVVQLTAAIEAAAVVVRHSDDDGERVIVHALALGPGFIYDRETFMARVRSRFVGVTDNELRASMLHMESRICIAIQSRNVPVSRHRASWVTGWMEER